MTLLQRLLADRDALPADLLQRLGCDRATLHRWQTGKSLPSNRYARLLVEVLRPQGLDFNGCYWPEVQEATGDE